MWKNCDRIATYIIIVMMAMQVSLFKIFAKFIPIFNYSYNTPLLCTIYVVMILAIYCFVLFTRLKERGISEIIDRYSYLIIELVVMVCALIVTDLVTIVNGQLRITNILTHNLDYIYVFLALPITVLLVERSWEFEHFVDAILSVSVLSMLLKIFVMIYYGATGVEIECIALENTFEGWIRNGRLRLTPPCFIMICVPLCIYMFVYVDKLIKKIFYCLCGLICMAYVYFVWQSRIAILFIGVGIGIMVMFGNTSKKLNIVRWSVVGVGAVGFMLLGGLKQILALFSTNPETSVFFAENKGHYYAYDIFWGHFAQNFLTGCGLNETLSLGVYTILDKRQWLCDAGILYSLEPMGILIGVFYLLMFARGVYVYMQNRKEKNLAIIALALTVTIMVCEISMDCFFTPTAFAVPFYIAIVEVIKDKK